LGHLGAFVAGDTFTVASFDPLLAVPVAERLFDDADFSSHLADGSILIKDKRRRIATELLGIANPVSGRPV